MSDNPPAFPRTGEGFGNPHYDEPGMTLRDWFAGQALPAAVARNYGNEWGINGSEFAPTVAKLAYRVADAMLAERNRKPSL